VAVADRAGTSPEYGARELKRTIHKHLTQPLATLVTREESGRARSRVRVEWDPRRNRWCCGTAGGRGPAAAHPTVLLVDDNRELLQFLERLMAESGWER
jgi:hypothetical protein